MSDGTPSVQEIFNMFRKDAFSHIRGLCELVDNAIDAGATWIQIRIAAKDIKVLDNGAGVRNMLDLVGIARHGSGTKGHDRIGRYGIGLKRYALWLWGRMRVHSLRTGKLLRLDIAWAKQTSWKNFPDPEIVDSKPSSFGIRGESGTLIHLTESHRSFRSDDFDKLVSKIGYTYTPALRSGCLILVHFNEETTCEPIQIPPLSEQIEEEIVINDHKKARLLFGIIKEGEPSNNYGMHLSFGPRVFSDCETYACGNHAVGRVYGELQYINTRNGQGWELETTKKFVDDEDDNELESRVSALIEPLLKKAQEQSQNVMANLLEKEMQERFKAEFEEFMGRRERKQAVEPRPKPGPKDGLVKTRIAKDHSEGEHKLRRRRPPKPLKVEFVLLEHPDSIGKANALDHRVWLNVKSPALVELHPKNLEALLMTAKALYVQSTFAAQQDTDNPIFTELPNDFGERFQELFPLHLAKKKA